MKRFDAKGMMIVPTPIAPELKATSDVVIVQECFCPKGHSMINPRVDFNGYSGIVFKVKKNQHSGLVALSPIFGDKSRISLDIDLVKNEVYSLLCPECESLLPVYSACDCGASLVALFASLAADFSDCICICNRAGCHHAYIRTSNEIMTDFLNKAGKRGHE